MKKNHSWIIVALVITLLVAMQVNAEDSKPEEPKPEINQNGQYRMIDGIGRGFANILAGWLEAPRGLVYYSVEYPVIGIIPGAFEGAGMFFIRTIGGAVDIITFGYLDPGNTVYDTMDAPMLPWESPWLPAPESEEDKFIDSE